jgi:hypothetical protein
VRDVFVEGRNLECRIRVAAPFAADFGGDRELLLPVIVAAAHAKSS